MWVGIDGDGDAGKSLRSMQSQPASGHHEKPFASSGMTHSLSNFVRKFLNSSLKFGRTLLPQQCLLCAGASGDALLCTACTHDLPWLPDPHCTICARPIPQPGVCGSCLKKPPRFDRVEAAFAYAFPADALIQAYKYGGNLAIAHIAARALLQTITPAHCDLIVPTPLARKRLIERGFNQALEVGRLVSHATGIPLLADACRKITDTPPQASLPWDARAKNLRGAFACDHSLDGKSVAVIDDVLTSGATLNELARCLKRAGAERVTGWIVARVAH
jgi:ComF family protein